MTNRPTKIGIYASDDKGTLALVKSIDVDEVGKLSEPLVAKSGQHVFVLCDNRLAPVLLPPQARGITTLKTPEPYIPHPVTSVKSQCEGSGMTGLVIHNDRLLICPVCGTRVGVWPPMTVPDHEGE